jgi:hypothetical protein
MNNKGWLAYRKGDTLSMTPPPVPSKPIRFEAYTEVVDWLIECQRNKRNKRTSTREMYATWASLNESSIRSLAKLHRLGLDFMELGVRGAIEKMHMDAHAEKVRSRSHTSAEETKPTQTIKSYTCSVSTVESKASLERATPKRPRILPEKADVIVASRRRTAANMSTVVDDAWRGRFASVERTVSEDDIREGILKGDAFMAGYSPDNARFFAGRVQSIPPSCLSVGAVQAADELDDLFEELQAISDQLRVSGMSIRHGLRVIGCGTYNLVVHPRDTSRLPKCLLGCDIALRFPRPGNGELPPQVDMVATELSNMLEAAKCDFGPAIKGAVTQIYSGKEKRALLLVAMEKMNGTLYSAINFIDASPTQPQMQVERMAQLLRDTVCKFSAMRFLFLDASPNNFLLRGTQDNCQDVCVCDLDPQLFRRTEQSVPTCLLLNLLIVGAHLKKNASVSFFKAWCNLPTGNSTLRDFVGGLPREGVGTLSWGRLPMAWQPHLNPSDETISEDLLSVVFHYFVSSAASCLDNYKENVNRNARQHRMLAQRHLPTMVFFGSRIGWPRELVDVFLDFWDVDLQPINVYDPKLDAVRKVVRMVGADA